MQEFCNEDGAELLAWARNLLYKTPDFVEVGQNKVVNLTPLMVTLFRYSLEYGIGTPNKQIQDGGHHTLIIAPRYPLGVDPVAMRAQLEAEQDALEARGGSAVQARNQRGVRAGGAQPVGLGPMSALMKAASTLPRTVKDPEHPDVDLEPVSDAELGDDPAFDEPSR